VSRSGEGTIAGVGRKRVGITRHFIDGQPRLATNARGDAVLAWRGLAGSGAAAHLVQVAFRPAGGRFGARTSFRQTGTDLASAVDANGGAFVAWTSHAPPSFVQSSIRLAARPPHRGWTAPSTISTASAGGPQMAPQTDGRLLLAWRDAQQGLGATRTGLVTTASRAADGTIGPAHRLSDVRTPGPQIAFAAGAETLIAWNTASSLEIGARPASLQWTTLGADGTFGTPDTRPGVGPGPVAMLGNGTAIAMWSSTAVRAVARPRGGTFGAAELVARRGRFPVLGTGRRTAVAVWLADGRLMAAARSSGSTPPVR